MPRLTIFLGFLSLTCPSTADNEVINIFYYEVPPFIYKNEKGNLVGIIPNMTRKMSEVCQVDFNFRYRLKSGKHLYQLMQDDKFMERYKKGQWVWLPITQFIPYELLDKLQYCDNLHTCRQDVLSNQSETSGSGASQEYDDEDNNNDMENDEDNESELLSNLGSDYVLELYYTKIDVMVQRSKFGILAKIRNGVIECRYMFLMGFLLSIIFAVFIWFIERWKNTDFPKHSGGVLTGLWLGLVTMTTVGYGDITPKSAIGRTLTIAWALTGVMLTSLVTSAMTTAFESTDYLKLAGKTVVAVEGSHEALIAQANYSAEVRTVSNYTTLFDDLADKKYDIGVVNSDVRKYHQKKFDLLRLVKQSPGYELLMLYPKNENNVTLDCIDKYTNYSHNNDDLGNEYYRQREHEERIDLDINVGEFFSDPSILTVSILAALCIMFALLFETTSYLKKRSGSVDAMMLGKKPEQLSKCNILQQPASKHDIELNKRLNTINEDMASIKATLQLICDHLKLKSDSKQTTYVQSFKIE